MGANRLLCPHGWSLSGGLCTNCPQTAPSAISTPPPLSDSGNTGESGKPTATQVHPDLQRERQAVYGDPKENHDGVAMSWVGLLQPQWERIKNGQPIPAWCVALLLAQLKINRMRRVFKQDNYDDLAVYASFAEKWQKEEAGQ